MINDVLSQLVVASNASPQLAQIRKASDEFQTAFVKTIVTEMRKEASQEFKDLPGAGVYEDSIDEVIAQKLSANSHLGLSDQLFNQMAKLQLDQTKMDIDKSTNSNKSSTNSKN